MADKYDMEKNTELSEAIDENTLNDLKKGGAQKIISKLSKEDKQKLLDTLSDREALEKILSTPQAKRIMELFKGGKR